jgi:hypothetical protein
MKHIIIVSVLFIALFVAIAQEGVDMENRPEINYPLLGAYMHKFMGIELNTLTWQLIDIKERNLEETERMIEAAHASLYHWSEVGNAVNLQRGQWLISHAYAHADRPEFSRHHAEKCWRLTEMIEKDPTVHTGWTDFDVAFAYEAMARAHGLLGNREEFEKYSGLAREYGEKIENEEDKKAFFETFNSVELK